MKIWGIAFILLGGGGIAAAFCNWHWWFRISSAGGHLVHVAFGRTFARVLNAVVGLALLGLGIADVTGKLPVSAYANAWLFENAAYLERTPGPNDGETSHPSATEGLERYQP